MPILEKPMKFSEVLSADISNKFIAHCDGFRKRMHINAADLKVDSIILIGPEGDFDEGEIVEAEENGFKGLSLSNYRLRTETAGVVCCQSFNFANSL